MLGLNMIYLSFSIFLDIFLACETPIARQAIALTISADITGQFLAGSSIVYLRHGDTLDHLWQHAQ